MMRAITPQSITIKPTVCARRDSRRWPASWATAELASISAMTAPATARLSSLSTVITNEGISERNSPVTAQATNAEIPATTKERRISAGTAGRRGLHGWRSARGAMVMVTAISAIASTTISTR